MNRAHNNRAFAWIRSGIGAVALGFVLTANSTPDQALVMGERFEIQSKALGETRRYFVHLPHRYRLTSDRYPVMVVLDGDEHFAHVSAAVDALSRTDRIPQMIVVSIPNTFRERDTRIWSPQEASNGTAKQFLSFIADELLPQIDREYRTRPYRVFMGHSLGGAYAVYALQNRPEVFNAYLAISPSFWQNKESLLTDFGPFLESHQSLQADLFMAFEHADDPRTVSVIDKVSNILTAKAPTEFRWKTVSYRDESHVSVPYRSTPEGLKQVFDGWLLNNPIALHEKSGLAGIEAHYAKVSKRMGYPVQVPPAVAQELFGALMERGRIQEVDELVQMAFVWYPGVPVVHEAAMMVSAAKGDQAAVIDHAKKLIVMNPGQRSAREELEHRKIDVSRLAPEINVARSTLNAYVGTYSSPDALLDVSISNDGLYATTDQGRFKLKALSDSSFYAENGAAKVTFEKNSKGHLIGVKLDDLSTCIYSTDTLIKTTQAR